jgi:Fic family protein
MEECVNIKGSLKQRALRQIQALKELQAEYWERVRKERAGKRLSQAVNALFSSPILTIRQLEKQMGIHYLAAERCMRRLVELGMLREITGKARNRVYQADEVMKILKE